jgi:hypothetical protein
MDYARLCILERISGAAGTTVASDFADLERWLPRSRLLITYTAGPYPDPDQSRALQSWLEAGGRWLALHGTSGGKAARVGERGLRRKMVRMPHHETLGCFFLNHPPARRFRVDVARSKHPLVQGLPESFEVLDELYILELLDPDCEILLTTDLPKDPSPNGFGFVYDGDPSLLADGRTRALGYTRKVGEGGVAYIGLGHCHSPTTNIQPFVDASVATDGTTPPLFRGPWETPAFDTLLCNGIAWGLAEARA